MTICDEPRMTLAERPRRLVAAPTSGLQIQPQAHEQCPAHGHIHGEFHGARLPQAREQLKLR